MPSIFIWLILLCLSGFFLNAVASTGEEIEEAINADIRASKKAFSRANAIKANNRYFPLPPVGAIRLSHFTSRHWNLAAFNDLANDAKIDILVVRTMDRVEDTPEMIQQALDRMNFHRTSLFFGRSGDFPLNLLIAMRPPYMVLEYELVYADSERPEVSLVVVTMVNTAVEGRKVLFRKFHVLIPLFAHHTQGLHNVFPTKRTDYNWLIAYVKKYNLKRRRFLLLVDHDDYLLGSLLTKSIENYYCVDAFEVKGKEHPPQTNWRGIYSDTIYVSSPHLTPLVADVNVWYTPLGETHPIVLDLRTFSLTRCSEPDGINCNAPITDLSFYAFLRKTPHAIMDIDWIMVSICMGAVLLWTGILLFTSYLLRPTVDSSDEMERKKQPTARHTPSTIAAMSRSFSLPSVY